jgi:AcrR family transcriptional regulator
MTYNRHNRTDDDAVLDAARDCVLAVGVRRTTLTDVARKAGVSRMTLYRRWPDVRTLVGDLMTREWIAVATGIGNRAAATGSARDRMVERLVAGVRAFRDHPLFQKIVTVNPEMLLPYVLERRGASQEALLGFIAEGLAEGHRDRSIRAGHVECQARTLLLVVQSFALSLQTMAQSDDPGLDQTAFYDELTLLLEKALTP